MPSDKDIIEQQILLWEESIQLETEEEQLTATPSILLPRLQDGLIRSEDRLRKLKEN